MDTDLKAAIQAEEEDMVSIRRDLHAHPELAFQEERTANLIADRLGQPGSKGVYGDCIDGSGRPAGRKRAWTHAYVAGR